jgi:hypothetical protein
MTPAHQARLMDGSVGAVFRRTRADGQRAEVRTDGLAGQLLEPLLGEAAPAIAAE